MVSGNDLCPECRDDHVRLFDGEDQLLHQKTDWSAYLVGCLSGFAPWIVLAAYFVAAVGSTETNPPDFVYAILLVYFIMFNTFSINMVLQYKGVGKWKDYLYGERVYIILSLIAKTALAWLTFIGIFAP
ncbi:hypothetical protein GCM10025861_12120 [Methanobacterium petrolearium]|nr:hypothetical protein GCM10025861_12120 [Methanobacterium petrolearium]